MNYNTTTTNGDCYDYCWHRLPCGICKLTNQICPKNNNSYTYDTIVVSETQQTTNQSDNTGLKVAGCRK